MTADARLVRQLRDIVGKENIRATLGDLTPYSSDATPLFSARPDVVVFPQSTAEVADILRLATEHRIPVIPRGAGTNLCAGTVPLHGGIVLVLTRMNRILEISEEESLARVQPGVITAVLAEHAAVRGLLYAPDPGSRTVATVGGNVACCAGGLRGLKYGVTRNYILGLEVVLPTGEVIRTGGRLWKDVAGYDLTRLLTGSEGTLAVITEIIVALRPLPATANTGVAYFRSMVQASRAVTSIIRSGIMPATLEFLDETCIAAVDDYAQLGLRRDAGALLLIGDDGWEDSVGRSVAQMGDICAEHGALDVTVAREVAASEALLAARRCSLPALSRIDSLTVLEDASVPRPRLPEMLDRIRAIGERHRVLFGTFGHAGDGNLHPTCILNRDDTDAIERMHASFAEVFAAALDLDGTITGEHGVGAAKMPYLSSQLGHAQVQLLRRIKAAFDPAGILNPGKLGS